MISINQLHKAMEIIGKIELDMVEALYPFMIQKEIKANEFFVRAGEVPKTMGFIMDGTFRLFYEDRDGHDFTKGFSQTGWFVVSYSALLEERESYFSIEAVRDSQVMVFPYKALLDLMKKDPSVVYH